MRTLLIVVLMVTACTDGDVPVEEACAEQAEAWCGIVEQCDSWVWPSCVQYRTDECLKELHAPVPADAQGTCLDALGAVELDESCSVMSGNWWPDECERTRSGDC